MLNRLTISTLLQTVISVAALVIVGVLSLTAWDSCQRLKMTNRITLVIDGSASMFKAMDRMRADRSTTTRVLAQDEKLDSAIDKYLRDLRDAEMPAMSHALEVLPEIEFAQKQMLLPEFDRLFKMLAAEQKEFWEEMSKPTASRRTALGKEYADTETALLKTLDRISSALAAEVNRQDSTIDQLLTIKQAAWLLRNTAGDASLGADIATDRARALVGLGSLDEAADALANARRNVPQNPDTWLLSATLSRRQGKLEEAQSEIQTAAALAPSDPAVGLEAGLIAALGGHDDAARQSWRSVMELAPTAPEAAVAKDYLAQLDQAPAKP